MGLKTRGPQEVDIRSLRKARIPAQKRSGNDGLYLTQIHNDLTVVYFKTPKHSLKEPHAFTFHPDAPKKNGPD